MTVKALLNELSSAEISEYIAFDQLKDAKYREALQSEMMTIEQRDQKLMMILGYKE